MRLLSREHLGRTGFDAAAFYRDLLQRDPVAALRGLGDCGAATDAASAIVLLTDPDPAVRKAAVEAVARLDAAKFRGRLVDCLADDDASVAATAARSLSRVGVPAGVTDQLWTMMSSDKRAHVARSCSRAARGLPRWSRSLIALRAVAAGEEPLYEIGQDLVDHVLLTWNRSFITPTPDEAAELTALLDSTSDILDDDRYEALVFAMSAYGIASVKAAEFKEQRSANRDLAPEPRGAVQRMADVAARAFKRQSK
jgi:hypothetical protein